MTSSGLAKPGVEQHLFAGTVAGCGSTLAFYPLDLIKVRYQVHEGRGSAYSSISEAFRCITSITLAASDLTPRVPPQRSIRGAEGWRGLYQGLAPAIIASAASWGGATTSSLLRLPSIAPPHLLRLITTLATCGSAIQAISTSTRIPRAGGPGPGIPLCRWTTCWQASRRGPSWCFCKSAQHTHLACKGEPGYSLTTHAFQDQSLLADQNQAADTGPGPGLQEIQGVFGCAGYHSQGGRAPRPVKRHRASAAADIAWSDPVHRVRHDYNRRIIIVD